MLELLKIAATSLGLTFALGGKDDLNLFADSIPEGETKKALFFSCYQSEGFNVTTSGYLTTNPTFELYILSPSDLTDEPEKRYQQVLDCKTLAKKIYSKMIEVYALSNVVADPIITATDNPLDGIRLSGKLTTNPESLC